MEAAAKRGREMAQENTVGAIRTWANRAARRDSTLRRLRAFTSIGASRLKPNLKRERALMQQHRQAIHGARSCFKRGGNKRRVFRIDGVVNHQMRREQARRNGCGVRASQTERGCVHDQIDICDLKSKRRFIQAIACKRATGPSTRGPAKKSRNSSASCGRFGESAIGYDESLAIFACALERNRARCAARAQHEHTKVAEIDRKFFANSAGKCATIGVEAAHLSYRRLRCH